MGLRWMVRKFVVDPYELHILYCNTEAHSYRDAEWEDAVQAVDNAILYGRDVIGTATVPRV